MIASDLSSPWIRSSYSGTEANCVEAQHCPGAIQVRDSKALASQSLRFRSDGWTGFLHELKAGRL
ncbi:DUF397 domain-containing protein [Streptomyces sp. ACA25]|uniref:DUF397 domain-containing protein n=1 Tax=Streptomyces sp. ACA25 TaxID=3022596 RepID=UPI002307BFC6|nr:DUF397 domain-containing protein [Streptomyces sp. ACA25]MDB1090182.1 DUF397 domain-containing protein [Streptomyces sp. ACA25]